MLLSDLLVDLYFYYVAAKDSFTEFCDLFNLSLTSVYLKIALEVVFAFRGCISRIWRGILANLARSRFEICTFSVRYRETSDIFAKENEEEGKTGFDTKQAQ